MKGSPYVGPRPFAKDDAAFFRGREREARDLTALIQAHPVVLIYAPSGAGKTSLLNATVVPGLEDSGCHVLPLARVGGDSPFSAEISRGENVFSLNVLASIQKSTEGTPDSLRACLRVIDAEQNPHGTLPTLTVLIIDQFEEIFTKHVEAWEQRQPFFQMLADTLSEQGRFRLVFAMREEYLASLDPYRDLMPAGLDMSYRLPLLGTEAALRAVIDPAREANVPFDAGVAEQLVTSLRQISSKEEAGSRLAEYVEPLQLQVVCKTVWDALPSGSASISKTNLATYGNVDDALRHYYDETIRLLMDELRPKKLNAHEVAVRDWIEDKFILPDGTRALYSVRDRLMRDSVQQTILNVLDGQHVLRPEMRAGRRWYELSHDRFVQPIQASNAAFRAGSDGLASLLAHVARDWESTGAGSLLLTGQQLTDAEALISRDEGQAFPVSRAIRELVRASRAQARTRASEGRFRFMIGVAAVVAVAAVLAVGFFMRKDSLIIAERSKELAEVSQQLVQNTETRLSGLLYAVLAVGRSLQEHREPPAEAIAALEGASKLIGPERVLESFASRINEVYFSEDGKQVLVSGYGLLVTADAGTGKTIGKEEASLAPVTSNPLSLPPPLPTSDDPVAGLFCCTPSSDAKVALATGPDTAKTVDPVTHVPIKTFAPKGSGSPGVFAFSPDGRYVTFHGQNGSLWIWNTSTGTEIDRLELPRGFRDLYFLGLHQFSNDGDYVWLANSDAVTPENSGYLVWKVGARKPAAFYRFGLDTYVTDWKMFPGGRAVVLGLSTRGLDVYVLDLNAPPLPPQPKFTVSDVVTQSSVVAGGVGLVTEVDGARTLRVWNLNLAEDSKPVVTMPVASDVNYVAISPDLKQVAAIRNQMFVGLERVGDAPVADERWRDPEFLIRRGCRQFLNQKDYQKVEKPCRGYVGE